MCRKTFCFIWGKPPQGNTLQVVPNPETPNDPLTRLEEAKLDAWLNEEAQRIDSMGEADWLGMLLGGFFVDKIFRKPKKKKVEKLKASKRRKQPITLPDGSRCFTEDCERHKGTTREGETPRHKRQDKPSAQQSKVLFSDSRCTVKQYADGNIVVHAHQVATAKDATESLKRLIAQCRELRKGQMRGKPNFGFIAPGEQTEFFVSHRTIKECVENNTHIRQSANKEAHFTAASLLDQLWESSKDGIRRKPKKDTPKDEQIKWVHERYAIIKMKKAFYRVKLTAFEYKTDTNSNMIYDIKAQKMR